MDDFSIVLQPVFGRLDTVEAPTASPLIGAQRWADLVGQRLNAISPTATWSVTPHASDNGSLGFYLRMIRQKPAMKIYEVYPLASWSPERVVTAIVRNPSMFEIGLDE